MSNGTYLNFGDWQVECQAQDGARIRNLCYSRQKLLTTEPENFQPPRDDYGKYETRPVYGYDDCFPTVKACHYPGPKSYDIPDHGELCWLPWQVKSHQNRLDCTVHSQALPIHFRRSLIFTANVLVWEFELVNNSSLSLPYLHVMHPLMPLDQISSLELPEFSCGYDTMNHREITTFEKGVLARDLLQRPIGSKAMLILRNLNQNQLTIGFKNKFKL